MADFTATYQDTDVELTRIQYLVSDNELVVDTAIYDGAKNPLTDTYQDFDSLYYSKQPQIYGVLYPPR
jgi:hypothetical protein